LLQDGGWAAIIPLGNLCPSKAGSYPMFILEIVKEVKRIENDIINWRRELHKIPEYSFELQKTSKYIREKLEEFDIEYRIAAKTGIIATIYGRNDGPTIGIRADMDALPIKEETNLPYKSEHSGFMHACGHDAHVAILLGAARILSENKDNLKGNVRLIFQPAEETTGGAKLMIEEGCLENPKVDYIIGLHIGTMFKEVGNGQIGVKKGGLMASVDSFTIKVSGKGGHGALPHLCIDPILIAAEMITSLQKIVSREINPVHSAVITTGMISGGTDFNIIPEEVMFKGTIRTLDKVDRDFIGNRIQEIVNQIALANRARAAVDYKRYYPVLINDEHITKELINSANKIVKAENVVEIQSPSMAAEDVSFYLNEIPGTFFILGSTNVSNGGIDYPHHNAKFDINENVLWIGTAIFIQFIIDHLTVLSG
jgi:amidohydrolase